MINWLEMKELLCMFFASVMTVTLVLIMHGDPKSIMYLAACAFSGACCGTCLRRLIVPKGTCRPEARNTGTEGSYISGK